MDKKDPENFNTRLFEELNSGMSCLVLELGYRLGLVQTLVIEGAMSPSELASHLGYSERYVRE